MELSEDYLDKMLNFAIKYHSNVPNELKKIPNNFTNLDNALESLADIYEKINFQMSRSHNQIVLTSSVSVCWAKPISG